MAEDTKPKQPGERKFSEAVYRSRRSLSADRNTLEAWARSLAADPTAHLPGIDEDSAPSGRETILAMGGVCRSVVESSLVLAASKVVTSSAIAGECGLQRRRLANRVLGLPIELARAAWTRDFTQATAVLLGILDETEALLCLLSQLGHQPVPDYLGGLASDSPFPSFRSSAANRGQVLECSDDASGLEPWKSAIGALIWPTAVIDSRGDLYTGHAEGQFVALQPDGSIKWRLSDPQMMYIDSTSALGSDGYLYGASTDVDSRGHQNQGRIWKLDPETGEAIWTFWARHFEDPEENPKAHLSGFFEGNVALGLDDSQVVVYAGSDDNHLYKLDCDGNLVWEYNTDAHPAGVVWTKPLLSPDGSTVFIGDLSGQLHAINSADGSRRWVTRVGGAVVSTPALGTHGQIYFGGFDGKLYCLDARDGEILWTYQTLGLIYSSPAIDWVDHGDGIGDIVIGSCDGGLYRLDRHGRKRWTYWTSGQIKASPALDSEGNACVGNKAGTLYCIGSDGRRSWSYATNQDVDDNDLNSSPSIGKDGTIYVGSTTGEVIAVSPAWCEANASDSAVSRDPGDDALAPAIEAGGGALVFFDRSGTPCFEPPESIGTHENLNFALFAVDSKGDVIESRLVPDELTVDISPKLNVDVRVESMGRYLYIVPKELMLPGTHYQIHVGATYEAGGERRRVETEIELVTRSDGGERVPFAIGSNDVEAVVFHEARVSSPKEIDALGQAMIDSQNFVVAPLYVDEDSQRFVAAACWVLDTGDGSFTYMPATVNKCIATGVWGNGGMHLEGSIRLIAQGINIPFKYLRFAASLAPDENPESRAEMEPGSKAVQGARIGEVVVTLRTPASEIVEFTDLIRVMGLADQDDDVVGFVTFKVAPFDDECVRRPDGASCDVEIDTDSLRVQLQGITNAESRWVHVDFYDKALGLVMEAESTTVTATESDAEVLARMPAGIDPATSVGIVSVDLFPVAVVALGEGTK